MEMSERPRLPGRIWGAGGMPHIMALHCSLAHAGAWAGLAAALPETEITALDLPGHGKAPDWDGTADMNDLSTRRVIAEAEALAGHAPLTMIGHSFGGTVALRIALERPDLVERLVLIEPVLFSAARAAGDPSFAAMLALQREMEALLRDGRQMDLARMFHAIWGGAPDFGALDERQRRYMADRMHIVVGQTPGLLQDGGGVLGYLRLESLGIPVLLVEGEASPPVIAAIQTELQRRLPQVERAIIPGAGHMSPITHPEQVAAVLRPFLTR